MGTIRIEEYAASGSQANRDLDMTDLKTLVTTTVDATTTTTAENITLDDNAKIVSIYAAEAHRVAVENTTGTTYAYIPATTWREFGVEPGGSLYYRLDA